MGVRLASRRAFCQRTRCYGSRATRRQRSAAVSRKQLCAVWWERSATHTLLHLRLDLSTALAAVLTGSIRHPALCCSTAPASRASHYSSDTTGSFAYIENILVYEIFRADNCQAVSAWMLTDSSAPYINGKILLRTFLPYAHGNIEDRTKKQLKLRNICPLFSIRMWWY